jgi:hypothetical protein
MTKATLYLEDKTYRAYKIRAAETDQTISELVNDAIQSQLDQDLTDIDSIRSRLSEPTESYEEFIRELKNDGLI